MEMAARPGFAAARVLRKLSKERLSAIAWTLGAPVPLSTQKALLVSSVLAAGSALRALPSRWTRDEVRAMNRTPVLDHNAGRERGT